MERRRVGEEPLRLAHHARAGEVLLGAEERARPVVAAADGVHAQRPLVEPTRAPCGQRGRPQPRGVGMRAPGVALVAPDVVPPREVDVEVLTAGLEEVRMVGDEHRRDARTRRAPAVIGCSHSSIEPQGFHRKSSAPHEDVVAGRHARQRAGDVPGEAGRPLAGEPVEVGRRELGAAVAAEQVAVERVEQHHAHVRGRRRWPAGIGGRSRHRPSLSRFAGSPRRRGVYAGDTVTSVALTDVHTSAPAARPRSASAAGVTSAVSGTAPPIRTRTRSPIGSMLSTAPVHTLRARCRSEPRRAR